MKYFITEEISRIFSTVSVLITAMISTGHPPGLGCVLVAVGSQASVGPRGQSLFGGWLPAHRLESTERVAAMGVVADRTGTQGRQADGMRLTCGLRM